MSMKVGCQAKSGPGFFDCGSGRQWVLAFTLALFAPCLALAQDPSPAPETPRRPHDPASAIGRADNDRDGKISFGELRAVRPQITSQRFERLDADGDGFLTPNDRARPNANRDLDAGRKLFLKVMESDANGDGNVTFAELNSAKPGFPRSNFERLDADGDGVLSTADQRRPNKGDRPHFPRGAERDGRTPGMRPEERLLKADTDRDGRVSFKEIRSSLPNLSEERFNRLDRNKDGYIDGVDRKLRKSSPKAPLSR